MIARAHLPRARLAGALLFLSLTGASPHYALDAGRPIWHARRESWGRREGLPAAGVTAIAQGSDGYLWVGTEAGLARFDGERFVVFDSDTAAGLRSSFITDLLPLPGEGLLVATLDGLYEFRRGAWTEVGDSSEPKRFIRLMRDPSGRTLAAYRKGVAEVRDGKLSPLPLRNPAAPDEPLAVADAALDGSGTLWLRTENGKRLLRVEGAMLSEDPLTTDRRTVVVAFATDREGVLWAFADPGGLLRRERGDFLPVATNAPLPTANIRTLTFGGTGDVWLGCHDGTVARIHAGTAEWILGAKGEFGGGRVEAVAVDAEGSVWIGGIGLHRLSDATVVTLSEREGWPAGAIGGVLADSRGRIWVAPQAGGLWRKETAGWKEITGSGDLGRPVVSSLVEDRTGTVWFGTARAGLWWVDARDRVRLAAPERRGDVVMSLAPCASGRCVLAGMSSGAWWVTDEQATGAPFSAGGEANHPVFATLVDTAGRSWVGTPEAGIFRRDGDAWTRIWQDDSKPAMVLDLWEDPEGAVWASTLEHGLLRLQEGRIAALTRAQGLPAASVYAVSPGAGDTLWMATPDGISAAVRADLIAVAEGRLDRARVAHLGFDDGLRAGECNGGGRVVSSAPDGRIYFATPEGVAYVEPARRAFDPAPPTVAIEEMNCDGSPVSFATEAPRLAPGTARCEIRYTAPTPSASGRVRFRYRLRGLDDAWVEAGSDRIARFTHLPPRSFTFEVSAARGGGAWGGTTATLPFSLVPRPWQTPWFWGVAVALLALALAGAYRFRVGALRRRQAALERVVADRTAELGEANRTLERRVEEGIARAREAERMAAYGEMVAGVAHEVRHPIFSIRSAAHLIGLRAAVLREEIASPLSVLERETGRMARLMEDLLHFAQPAALTPTPIPLRPLLDEAVATARAAGGWDAIAIEIAAASDLPEVRLDRPRLLQVLINLLENARKHATGLTRVRLEARRGPEGTLALTVADDGAGMDAETLAHAFEPFYTRGAGTGLGLAIVRRIVREHGGTVDIESSPGQGSRLLIRLPIG